MFTCIFHTKIIHLTTIQLYIVGKHSCTCNYISVVGVKHIKRTKDILLYGYNKRDDRWMTDLPVDVAAVSTDSQHITVHLPPTKPTGN